MIARWVRRKLEEKLRVSRWGLRKLDERLRIASVVREAVAKVFPDHWSFMLGEIALYAFVSLLLTGTFLAFFFDPSSGERIYAGDYAGLHNSRVSAAYASAVELSFDVRGGLLVRQTHHWAALIFVAAIVTHMLRNFFTGAFRRPRELNWIIGVTLLVLAIANGFAGYSLPDDLLSGTGLRIANSIALSMPIVGTWAAFLLFGGEFPGESIIPRLYILHVLLLPGLIAALIGAHMGILIRQKHTHFAGPGRNDHNVVGSKMWPTYAFRSFALLSALFAVTFALGGLVQINPVWLWGPFDPGTASAPAQPDWFMGWLEGALRLYPPIEFTVFGYLVPAPFVPGVLLPGLTFAIMYVWPWLDRLITKDRAAHHLLDRPRHSPARMAVGVWALSFYGLLLLAGSDDVLADLMGLPVLTVMKTMRIVVIVVPFLFAAAAYALARALRANPEQRLSGLRWKQIRKSDVVEEETRHGGS
ncbi:cytochrome bc1 complex cytochrome b subunit [Sinosporangium siamense]|uniref:Cytochrome bc1 complex cytochrome b subunit n=1 Tax=Sinosporangium siamense TaxID=1367973 RepID=A0A919RLW6_9ACTN|nr:ubiquinol-cytochrome c reductase cytochrome b subunit [Sinosporangium siamense]GII94541.1 hypothetical protein Ssi02_47720 [Sinosporangium siamense]